MKTHLHRMLEHMHWADRLLVTQIGAAPVDRALVLLSHLLAAERVWLSRLRGEADAGIGIWPRLSPEECGELAAENLAGYSRYLEALPEERLNAVVRYRNSAGAEHSTPVVDILTHVFLHGSYHRGQIASVVRGAGAPPPNTDYIAFVRERTGGRPG